MDVWFNLVSSFLLLVPLCTSPTTFLCLPGPWVHCHRLWANPLPWTCNHQLFLSPIQDSCPRASAGCLSPADKLPVCSQRLHTDPRTFPSLWFHCLQDSHSYINLYFLSETNIVVVFGSILSFFFNFKI